MQGEYLRNICNLGRNPPSGAVTNPYCVDTQRFELQAAAEVGVETEHVRFPRTVAENELLRGVELLNADPHVHGIIVQLPLDSDNPIDAGKVRSVLVFHYVQSPSDSYPDLRASAAGFG